MISFATCADAGERYAIQKRGDSNIITDRNAPFDSGTVSHETFTETRGERFPVRRPQDHELTEKNAAFDDVTVHREQFKEGKGTIFSVAKKVSKFYCYVIIQF